jgi:hypothetical protein
MTFERTWSEDRNAVIPARETREIIEKNEPEQDNSRQYPSQKAIEAAHEIILDRRVRYLSYQMGQMDMHRIMDDLISWDKTIAICWVYHAW